jgi:hypothetical protein
MCLGVQLLLNLREPLPMMLANYLQFLLPRGMLLSHSLKLRMSNLLLFMLPQLRSLYLLLPLFLFRSAHSQFFLLHSKHVVLDLCAQRFTPLWSLRHNPIDRDRAS